MDNSILQEALAMPADDRRELAERTGESLVAGGTCRRTRGVPEVRLLASRQARAAFSQVKVDSLLCRFPTLRSGHARAPSFRYQRA